PLNEGRGEYPGDGPATARAVDDLAADLGRRSTRAGVSTPATVRIRVRAAKGPVRSTRAGVSTPATAAPHSAASSTRWNALNEGRGEYPGDGARGSSRTGRGSRRSTRAGVSTPATAHRHRPHHPRR